MDHLRCRFCNNSLGAADDATVAPAGSGQMPAAARTVPIVGVTSASSSAALPASNASSGARRSARISASGGGLNLRLPLVPVLLGAAAVLVLFLLARWRGWF